MGNSPASAGCRRLRDSAAIAKEVRAVAGTTVSAADPRSPTEGIRRTPIAVKSGRGRRDDVDDGVARVGGDSSGPRGLQRRLWRRTRLRNACVAKAPRQFFSGPFTPLDDELPSIVDADEEEAEAEAEAYIEDGIEPSTSSVWSGDRSAQSDTELVLNGGDKRHQPTALTSRKSPLARLRASFLGFLSSPVSPTSPTSSAIGDGACVPAVSSAPPTLRHRMALSRRRGGRRQPRRSPVVVDDSDDVEA